MKPNQPYTNGLTKGFYFSLQVLHKKQTVLNFLFFNDHNFPIIKKIIYFYGLETAKLNSSTVGLQFPYFEKEMYSKSDLFFLTVLQKWIRIRAKLAGQV